MRRFPCWGTTASRACVIAGGTDLLGKMKDAILPAYPEALVNIKTIPGLSYIKEDEGMLRIGALATLERDRPNDLVRANAPALAQAACRTASPHMRDMGTIAGNHLPGHPLLVLPQPEQPLLLPAQEGRQVLCHQGRQPLPLHLRRQRVGRMHGRASQRYRAGLDSAQCQDQDLARTIGCPGVLRGQPVRTDRAEEPTR